MNYYGKCGAIDINRRHVSLAVGPAGWRPFAMWGAGDRRWFGALRVGLGLGAHNMAVLVLGEHEDHPGPWCLSFGPVQAYVWWRR